MWIEFQIVFGKVIALRILVSLARAIRRLIGNTGDSVGAIDAHMRKVTAFHFCLFGAAPNRESFFFENKFAYHIAID